MCLLCQSKSLSRQHTLGPNLHYLSLKSASTAELQKRFQMAMYSAEEAAWLNQGLWLRSFYRLIVDNLIKRQKRRRLLPHSYSVNVFPRRTLTIGTVDHFLPACVSFEEQHTEMSPVHQRHWKGILCSKINRNYIYICKSIVVVIDSLL